MISSYGLIVEVRKYVIGREFHLRFLLCLDYEEKMQEQQKAYQNLKSSLSHDFDAKILLIKSDIQKDLEDKLSFLSMHSEEKFNDELKWKKLSQEKDKELLDLQAKYDVLEDSSKNSERIAADQARIYSVFFGYTHVPYYL